MTQAPAIYLSRIADLEQQPEWVEHYRQWLCPAEAARLERMRGRAQRHRFLLARALLRWLLANHLGLTPADVPLRTTPEGKPFVQTPDEAPNRWPFSLSHSGQWVAVALTGEGRIGVDLEQPQRVRAMLEMANRYFHPTEARRLTVQPEPERTVMFYRLWTQKEAYLKACGLGVGGGLDRIYFPNGDGHPHFLSQDCSVNQSWRVVHWYNPVNTVPACFLSLALDAKNQTPPVVFQCLPGVHAVRPINAEPN